MPYPTRSSVRGLADDIAAGRLDPAGRAEEALRQFDADTACEVLLAAAVAGLAPSAQLVARVLPDLSSIDLLPPLVGACGGDRVELLLDCVEADRMSSERDALALFLAVQLLEGPAPPRLSTLMRLQARRRLGVEASILLALAAKELRDPQVLEVAKSWLPMANVVEARPLRERLRRLLSAPILDALDERAPTRGVSGFTVRRAVPKVGRNDPCHCGSGKKYKKCCEATDGARAADPSPQAGLTRPEYLRTSGATMSADEVSGLRPSDLAEVDFAALRTHPLIAAVRRASLFRRWDLAERAMDVLAARTDTPDGADADGYRLDLISDLLQAGEFAGAERQMALLRDGTSMPASDLLKLELHHPSDRTLAYLEDLAARGLRKPHGGGLLDLSFGLLAASPALGILTARASLSLPRAIDSMMLLDVIEEARDRLALPPGDPSRDTFELLLDRDAARRVDDLGKRKENERSQRLAGEADALRAKLNESKARVAELELSLRAQEATLQELPAVPSPSVPAPVMIVEDAERRRLRAKVDELKHMLTERNQERSRLRRELARVNETLATDAAGSSDPLDEEDEGAPVTPPRGVLIPTFSSSARDELREVPAAIAGKAILAAASLAAGEVGVWHQVKSMVTATRPLLSCRVGIHHRILARIEGRELTVLAVVHRKDLEAAIRRCDRAAG